MADWTPTTAQVAQWVPWMTVDTSNPGAQVYVGDFTSVTSPNAAQAMGHIAAAETMILARVPSMPVSIKPLATVAASRYAAWTLAVAWARTDEDRRRADMLKAAYDAAWKDLTEAADNAGADALSPLPVISAPDPVPWGDDLFVGTTTGHRRWYYNPE